MIRHTYSVRVKFVLAGESSIGGNRHKIRYRC